MDLVTMSPVFRHQPSLLWHRFLSSIISCSAIIWFGNNDLYLYVGCQTKLGTAVFLSLQLAWSVAFLSGSSLVLPVGNS
jgi:hypothetical protein